MSIWLSEFNTSEHGFICNVAGPLAWMQMFPSCDRDRQSPIDIVDSVAIRQQAEQWQLSGWISENKYEIEDEIHASE